MLPRPDSGQPATDSVPESMVRAQLQQMLASEVFARSERLSRFLRFIVEHALDSQAASLKEQVLACELYGRSTDFDAATDPVVRVDARRLRDKLREYYAESPEDPVLIALPKGGYIPSFQWNPRESLPAVGQIPPATERQTRTAARFRWSGRWLAASVAAAIIAGVAAWLTLPKAQPDAPKLTPLTSHPGNESWPALSPDGNDVAFACTGPDDPTSSDICIKSIGDEAVQRLTKTRAHESRPAWSPDGREIAFVRDAGGRESGVFIVSRTGGAEHRISDTGTAVAWTPDGNSVLIRDRSQAEPAPFAIFQVELGSLRRRRLTQPRVGGGDWSYDVSPDGDSLALIRTERPGVSDLYVMPMKGGEPRRLTEWNTILWGPSWTPDGEELVYAVNDRLWRVSARAAQPGRGSPVADIPMPAGHVSISRPHRSQAARLAFHTPQQQITLRKIDLNSVNVGGVFQSIVSLAPSTRKDIPGPFSPDGSKLAFTSTRGSTDHELWVADNEGASPRQVTSLGSNTLMLAHSWSPDGRRILFESAVDGNSDLYVISVGGRNAVRLTTSPAIEALANWSRDGRWVYYTKVVSGMNADIWRMTAEGSQDEQITKNGGSEPQESPDGRYIYYLDRAPLEGTIGNLMRVSVAGGDAKMIREGISPLYWSVTEKGIYFLREEGQVHSIHLYRFADEKTERVGVLPFRVTYRPQGRGRLTVSRDGRWALVSVTDRWEGDLMLLDSFR